MGAELFGRLVFKEVIAVKNFSFAFGIYYIILNPGLSSKDNFVGFTYIEVKKMLLPLLLCSFSG
jgi:hypothetical protein